MLPAASTNITIQYHIKLITPLSLNTTILLRAGQVKITVFVGSRGARIPGTPFTSNVFPGYPVAYPGFLC